MKTSFLCLQNKMGLFSLLSVLAIQLFGSTSKDSFAIHMLGHASLYIEYNGQVIHIDPYSSQGNYSNLPDADLIYITHAHGDHYDTGAISKVKNDSTVMVCTQAVKNLGTFSGPTIVMKNGDSTVVKGIPTKAVASYNLTAAHHPKGTGNGYLLTIGEKRVYIAGDTENIPEMKSLGKIDIAFLPMNLPYTMSVTMAAEAVKVIKPDILYVYHFGNSDTAQLRKLLVNEKMVIRMGKSSFLESARQSAPASAFLLNASEFNIQIFPNPVSEYVTLNNFYAGASVFIHDLTGKEVLKQEQLSIGETIIDVQFLKNGPYVVKTRSNRRIGCTLLLKK
jgi:L-ascorbate metabolism protein UlaG (beta-lactamase superfamily)